MAKKTAEPAPTGSRIARLRAVLGTPLGRFCGHAFLVAVAMLALSLVVRSARAAVHRMPAYRIGSGSVQFLDLPQVADARMRVGLKEYLAALLPADPTSREGKALSPCTFDADVERTLKDVLSRHPMVREVRDLDVRFPSEVRVRATLRLPLAILRAPWGDAPDPKALYDVPVDAESVVLDPNVYSTFLARYPPIAVTGLRTACPGVGRHWLDREDQVAEALAAARVANRLNASLPALGHPRIAEADVTNYTLAGLQRARGEVIFVLEDRRRIVWGRTERDVSHVTYEDSFDVKVQRLLDLLDTWNPAEPKDLDVRFQLRPESRARSFR